MIRILFRSASKKAATPVESIEPVPFFKIQDASPKLPSVRGQSPSDLLVKNHPDFKKHRLQLMNAIDLDHRQRSDPQGEKTKFIDPKSPDALSIGDLISVETIRSKSYPRSSITTGILTRIRHFGYASSIFVESVVMGTTIKTQFKIYSPLVKKISLIKKKKELKENIDGGK